MAKCYQCSILYNFFPCTDEAGPDTSPKHEFRGSTWSNGTFFPKEFWDHWINTHLSRIVCICSCSVDGEWTGLGHDPWKWKDKALSLRIEHRLLAPHSPWPGLPWTLKLGTFSDASSMIPLYELKISITVVNSLFPLISFLLVLATVTLSL